MRLSFRRRHRRRNERTRRVETWPERGYPGYMQANHCRAGLS
jgi:hypothetical protein